MHKPNTLRAFKRCVSYSSADSYDLLGLMNFFKKKGMQVRLLRDVLHVSHGKRTGDIFIFNHGCAVMWGYTKNFEHKIMEYLTLFAANRSSYTESDLLYYRYAEETTIDMDENLRLDIITLDNHDPMIKLAMSYGLAQSIKLEAFEEAIKDTIKKNNYLPEEIASRGTISLSRRAIFKRIGEIFIARRSINLNIEYLDEPEFFWRNPNLEPFYSMTKKYLDIPSRVMALNQKLDVLQELLHILNGQVQHRYSSFLESVIIVLIAAEILISLFQLHIV